MPTTNPVPSQDPTDLLFNAQKLDEVVNSASATYADRLGATRRTLAGLEAEFPNAQANAAAAAASATAAAASATQAANEATSAATAVDLAFAEATAAQASRVAAEAARDAAQLSAGVYATTAAGLAATTSGKYFNVPSAESREFLILYQNSSGTAVEVKRYPSAALALDSSYRSTIVVNTRASFLPTTSEPRLVVIRADEQALGKTTLNYWDGQTLRFGSEIEFNPASMFTTEAGGIYNISDKATLYQDAFMQSPVTAAGQSVAVAMDIRGHDLGVDLVSYTGFTAASGWTINATNLTASAANSDLYHPVTMMNTVGGVYIIEFELAITAGSVRASVQLSDGPTFTTSGRKKVRILHTVGTNPAVGFYFKGIGFTGSITNLTVKKDSRNHLVQSGASALPTYQVDANGVPYLLTTGAQLVSTYDMTGAIPVYFAAAVARLTRESKIMMNLYGNSGWGINFTNQNGDGGLIGSTGTGGSALTYTPVASWSVGQPFVADVLFESYKTSSWVYGGERDIVTATNGGSRTVVNSSPAGETITAAKLSINYNNASSHRFYGGVLFFGKPTDDQRRGVNQWLKRICGLGSLEKNSYDVFAIAGQSNAMGVGNYTTSVACPLGAGVEYLAQGFLKPLADPTQHNVTTGGNFSLAGSAWPSFGAKYSELTGRRACIVGGAFSGVGLLHSGSGPTGGWTSSGPLVANLAAKIDSCLSYLADKGTNSQLRGVIWAGGEQDVLASFTLASYKAALVDLRDRFRAATGNPTLKLMIVSLDKSLDAGNEAKYAIIRQAQAEAAAENDGIELIVPFQNYYDSGLSDGVHMNQSGLNDIGRIAANGAATALKFQVGYMSFGTKPSVISNSGTALSSQPVVRVLTADGVVDTSFTGIVTASLLGTGALGGTVRKAAVAGVAAFTDLAITGAGTSQLKFTAAGRGDLQSYSITTT